VMGTALGNGHGTGITTQGRRGDLAGGIAVCRSTNTLRAHMPHSVASGQQPGTPACGQLALAVLGKVIPGEAVNRRRGEFSNWTGKVVLEPDDYQLRLVKHGVEVLIDGA